MLRKYVNFGFKKFILKYHVRVYFLVSKSVRHFGGGYIISQINKEKRGGKGVCKGGMRERKRERDGEVLWIV
jgi:hypothetical protein